MTEAYDGRQVVGMDPHWRRSVLVRMTEDGRKLEAAVVVAEIGDIRRFPGPGQLGSWAGPTPRHLVARWCRSAYAPPDLDHPD